MRTEEKTLIITGKAPETKLRLKKILYIKKSSPKLVRIDCFKLSVVPTEL